MWTKTSSSGPIKPLIIWSVIGIKLHWRRTFLPLCSHSPFSFAADGQREAVEAARRVGKGQAVGKKRWRSRWWDFYDVLCHWSVELGRKRRRRRRDDGSPERSVSAGSVEGGSARWLWRTLTARHRGSEGPLTAWGRLLLCYYTKLLFLDVQSESLPKIHLGFQLWVGSKNWSEINSQHL